MSSFKSASLGLNLKLSLLANKILKYVHDWRDRSPKINKDHPTIALLLVAC
jgi:hypothetical protein